MRKNAVRYDPHNAWKLILVPAKVTLNNSDMCSTRLRNRAEVEERELEATPLQSSP